MCMGPELALALTAAAGANIGGNYLQTEENNKSQQAQINARNAALQEGITQQHQNQAQATDVLNNTLQKFSAPQQGQDLGALVTNRTNTIQNNMTPAAAPDTNLKSAPQVVQSDLANKMAKVSGYGAQQAGALGKLGATGDQFNNNNLALADSGLNLGTISNFAQGQLGVNKLKQQVDMNNARKAPSTLGSILSTIGSAAGMYAMGKAAAPAAPSAGMGDALFPSVTTGPGAVTTGTGGLY